MINLDVIESEHQEDLQSVNDWCEKLYTQRFSSYFVGVRELYSQLQSVDHPITDESLMWILTELPIELFNVSSVLNEFITHYEVLKLKIKNKEIEVAGTATVLSISDRKDYVAHQVFGDKLLLSAYNSVATRVEKEISFSKELIMGAKKVWDARRSTEKSNPVSEVNPGDDLPEYKPTANTYIHG